MPPEMSMTITVAVVDDDPNMLKGVERLLNVHGFGTAVFTSAEDFLDHEWLDGEGRRHRLID